MNSLNIIGRAGGEVELRYTPSGKAVAEITLALDDGFGENKKTVWLPVTIWGATAELAAKAVQKGDRLGISGRLTQDEWEDKATSQKRTKIKVICEQMHLLGGKRENAPQSPPEPRSAPDAHLPPNQRQGIAPTGADDEDDIPF